MLKGKAKFGVLGMGRKEKPPRQGSVCGTVPVLQPSIQGDLVLTPRCTHAFARMHTKHTAMCTHKGMLCGLCTVCKTSVLSHSHLKTHTQCAQASWCTHTRAFLITLSCFEYDICTHSSCYAHQHAQGSLWKRAHTCASAHACASTHVHRGTCTPAAARADAPQFAPWMLLPSQRSLYLSEAN